MDKETMGNDEKYHVITTFSFNAIPHNIHTRARTKSLKTPHFACHVVQLSSNVPPRARHVNVQHNKRRKNEQGSRQAPFSVWNRQCVTFCPDEHEESESGGAATAAWLPLSCARGRRMESFEMPAADAAEMYRSIGSSKKGNKKGLRWVRLTM